MGILATLKAWLNDLTRKESPMAYLGKDEFSIRTISGAKYDMPAEMKDQLMMLVKVYVQTELEQKTKEIDELSAGTFVNPIKE